MSEAPLAGEPLRVRDWNGIMSDADYQDLPPGAAQWSKNTSCRKPGLLQVRQGLLEVTFDGSSQSTSEANHCIGIATYTHHSGEMILFQLDDGSIQVGRDLGVIS
jgi:hypothetical protein